MNLQGIFSILASWVRAHPIASTVIAAAIVLLVRKTDALLNPQFWAEDGPVFFVQADVHGLRALLLPHAGYHHLLPRLIAALAAPLDARWIPAAYAYASLAGTLAVAAAVCSPRVPLRHRHWLALAIVLVPHTGEVFLNLANLQWITALGLAVLLIGSDPNTICARVVDAGTMILLGMTGPFVVLLLPLFLWRAARGRSGASLLLAAIAAGCSAIQLSAIVRWPDPLMAVSSSTDVIGPWMLAEIAGIRVWGALILGAGGVKLAGPVVAGVLGFFVGAWILSGAFASEGRFGRLMLWGIVAVILGATLVKFSGDPGILRPLENGDRYFFLPKVITIWLIIQELAATGRRRTAGLCLLIGCAATNLPFLRFTPYKDFSWEIYARRISAGEEVVVPINPEGWTFRHPGR